MPAYLTGKSGKSSIISDSINASVVSKAVKAAAGQAKSMSAATSAADNSAVAAPITTTTEEPTDDILLFTSTANHLSLPGQNLWQPRL